jgi:signal transduction histidine kinase
MGGDQTTSHDTAFRIAALAILYTIVAKLGLSLDAVSGFATLVWPPTGLALASLLLFGFRLWPGVFLGALAVNVWNGAPMAVALGIALGNTLEAVLGVFVMRRFAGSRSEGGFDSLRHVLGLILGASALSTLVSATFGVVSLSLGGIVQSTHQAVETWRAWWVGDVLGDLVVAPLLLSWARRGEPLTRRPGRIVEAISLTTFLSLATYAVFFRPPLPAYPFGSPYILFPFFVWAALRFELRGATLATAFASTLAVWGTARGSGPFAREALASGLLALQTFMGCAAITPLVVAGVTRDRARAIRVQETFVATVSHDLKNPLSALLMSGESLLRRPTEEAIRKHHDVLRRSVDRMMRLIADLLDASAIERGRMAMELRPENSRALVNDAVELLRPLAAPKRLSIQSQHLDTVTILCDRDRILQVFSNVVGNSIKFSPEEATITVTVQLGLEGACFSVRDAGPGISPQDLSHVFERNWHTTSSTGGGSGLGLFIAKGIVEVHGGRIWAESKLGQGSIFHFILPVDRGPPRRALADRLLRAPQ